MISLPEGDVAVFCSCANFIASTHIFWVIKDTTSLPSRKVHSNIHFGPHALLQQNKVRVAEVGAKLFVRAGRQTLPSQTVLGDTNSLGQLFIIHAEHSSLAIHPVKCVNFLKQVKLVQMKNMDDLLLITHRVTTGQM